MVIQDAWYATARSCCIRSVGGENLEMQIIRDDRKWKVQVVLDNDHCPFLHFPANLHTCKLLEVMYTKACTTEKCKTCKDCYCTLENCPNVLG